VTIPLTRRLFLSTGLAFATVSSPCQAQGIEWAEVALLVIKSAASFIVGKALSSALGGVTTEDIISAIDSAVLELKRYIYTQTRQAVIEGQIRLVQSQCKAVDLALRDYSKIGATIVLQSAYDNNVAAISLSESLLEGGLPTYIIAVSQRAFIMKAISDREHNDTILKQYGNDLQSYARYVRETAQKYIASLSPEKRLGPVTCQPSRPDDSWHIPRGCPGGGFCVRPPTMQCSAVLDGNVVSLTEVSDFHNGDEWDINLGLAYRGQAAILSNLTKFQQDARSVFAPLDSIFGGWNDLSHKISSI